MLLLSIVGGAALVAGAYLPWRRAVGRPLPSLAVGIAASGVLGLATASVLVRAAGSSALADVVSRIDGRSLAAVVGLQVLSSATLTQIYRATHAANGGRLPYRDALTITLGAFSLTQLLPGGGAAGGLFAIRRLRNHGADAVRATTTVLLVGLIMMGTLGVVISIATTITALYSPTYSGYAIASTAVTGLVVGALLLLRWLTLDGRTRRRFATQLDRVRWRGRQVGRGWAESLERHDGLLLRPTAMLGPAGWSAAKWSFDVALLALLLHTVGAGAPLLAVLVAFSIGHLLNTLPLTPGGIGVVEAGLAGTLIGFGADPAATALAIIGYRAIAFWLPVLVAAPVVMTGLRRRSPAVEVAL